MTHVFTPRHRRLSLVVLAVAFVVAAATHVMAQRAYFYDRGPAPYKVEGRAKPNKRDYGYSKTDWRRWPGTSSPPSKEIDRGSKTDLPGMEIRPEDEDLGGGASEDAPASGGKTDAQADSPPTMPPDIDDPPPPAFGLPPEGEGGVEFAPEGLSPTPLQDQPPVIDPPTAPSREPPSPPSFEKVIPEPQPPAFQGSGTSTHRRRPAASQNRVASSASAQRSTAQRSTALDAKSSDLTDERRTGSPIEPAEMRFQIADEPANLGQIDDDAPLELPPSASTNPLRRRQVATYQSRRPITRVAHFETVEPQDPPRLDSRPRKASQPSRDQVHANPLRRG